jgi:hypothetical protein
MIVEVVVDGDDLHQTRDYLDVAALADKMGTDRAAAVLVGIDEFYADQRLDRVPVALQLADPRPADSSVVEEVLSYSRPYGVVELMEGLLDRTRRRAEDAERVQIAAEVCKAVADSGLSKAEFAANIGTSARACPPTCAAA